MESAATPPLAALVGLDWGSTQHDIALQVTGATTVEHCRLPHEPRALVDWLCGLRARFGGAKVGIAIETSKGAIVHALLESDQVVLYPINPRSLHRFREAFSPNGAKDDGPDAALLLSLLVHHQDRLPAWRPHDGVTRRLQTLVQHRRALVDLRTQLTQQLHAALQAYYPLALAVTGDDLYALLACDFVLQWPTLDALQRARATTLRRFYVAHNCRKQAKIEARLQLIRDAVPLTNDLAIIEPQALLAQCLAQQLRTLAVSITTVEERSAEAFAAHPDAALFESFPGAGETFAPRLCAAFGSQRDRYPTASDMQKTSGIAPVTVRSGNSTQVIWRWATSTFTRQTFHEFAQYSIRHVAWARAFYHRHRQRGHSHHATLRALAFKWIRIIWRCWQDRTPYDDARYVRALQQRGSPLCSQLQPTAAT
jgi:transposase